MIFIVTVLNFKDVVDLPRWRPVSVVNSGNPSISNNSGIFSDWRNNEDRHPFIFSINGGGGSVSLYNIKQDGWSNTISGFGGFTNAFFMPAQGPRGTIAAGATTTSFTLTTALPATVGVNQLANRGDGRGFKVRVIGNAGGSSGKTEERLVIANTSGTTPTIVVDSAFSFTPAVGDAYEFLSGRLFVLGTSAAAGQWKYYDVLTNSFSGNLSVVNLVVDLNWNSLVGLDEQLVPFDRNPGEGFFGVLIATGSAGTTLTGQAVGGDVGVVLNQYRNFQIRIVQDTAIPTAVGQRRNITSHTAGPSPVYTVPVWTVTPSATATYVIENNGNRIIEWANGSTQTSTYSISGDAWDANVTFAVRPAAAGTGVLSVQSFGIEPDTASPSNARHSFIFAFRGNGTTTLDLFDIAGAATGLWTSAITYSPTISVGGNWAHTYDTATNQGRYIYISTGSATQFFRFDVKNRITEQVTNIRIGSLALNSPVRNISHAIFIDGSTKMAFVYTLFTNASNIPTYFLQLPITR